MRVSRWFGMFVAAGLFASVGCGTTTTVVPASGSGSDASAPEDEDTTTAEAGSANAADGGKARDGSARPAEGTIEVVAPQLQQDLNTNVYTASFRLKNGTSHSILELSSLVVSGTNTFPEIDRSICPPDTPGYQWALSPAEMSEPLGVAFASSPTNLRTVIDLTCGTKETLQSVPYGFNAQPPFTLTMTFLLDSGDSVTVEETLTP